MMRRVLGRSSILGESSVLGRRTVLGRTLLCAVLVGALAGPAPATAQGLLASDGSGQVSAPDSPDATARPGLPTDAADPGAADSGAADPGGADPGARQQADEDPAGTVTALTLAPTPAAAAALRPKLRTGSTGPAVVYVQQQLGVTPTSGWYGPLTRRAVKKFQTAQDLKRTGRVTRSTWRALLPAADPAPQPAAGTDPGPGAEQTPAAAAALRPKLRKGSTGPAVVYVQQQLGVTPTSGWYGPLTRRAVKKFQTAQDLKRTGRVTRSTWRALFTAAEAEPAEPAPTPGPTEPSAPTPEQAAAQRPPLARGMGPGDPAVIYVQRFLRVSPDSGYFGTLTTAAVTAYQSGLGLAVSGAVDAATWEAILAGRTVPAPSSPPAPSPTTDPTPPTTSGYRYPLPANPTVADRALVFALAQVGKPYVLGGNGPDVFDCSGLVQQAYLSAGVALPRLASQQRFAGTRVDLDDLLPGDLLYYQDGTSPRSGHISMYAGNGLAVEAANPRRGVRIRDLDEPWYRDRFVAATRIG